MTHESLAGGQPTPEDIEEIENEGRTRHVSGWIGLVTNGLALALSLYSLYWVVGIVQPQIYRVSFLLISLVLIFLLFRSRPSSTRVSAIDWFLVGSERRRARVADPRLRSVRLPGGDARCRSTSRSAS